MGDVEKSRGEYVGLVGEIKRLRGEVDVALGVVVAAREAWAVANREFSLAEQAVKDAEGRLEGVKEVHLKDYLESLEG